MKRLLMVSVILNFILIATTFAFFYFYPESLKYRRTALTAAYHERQASMFETLPNQKEEVIFLGASLIEGANWHEMFQNTRILNRGVAGDKTADVLNRLGEVTASKPHKIFLQCGFNDLSNGISQDSLLANYAQIMSRISKESPQTLTYLISLLPVRYELLGENVKNEQLMVINGKLKEMAEKKGVTFIDMFAPLEEAEGNHQLNINYTNDGLHLTADGYTRFKALLQRFL